MLKSRDNICIFKRNSLTLHPVLRTKASFLTEGSDAPIGKRQQQSPENNDFNNKHLKSDILALLSGVSIKSGFIQKTNNNV